MRRQQRGRLADAGRRAAAVSATRESPFAPVSACRKKQEKESDPKSAHRLGLVRGERLLERVAEQRRRLRRHVGQQLDAALDQPRDGARKRRVGGRQHAAVDERRPDAREQLVLGQRAQVLAVHPRQLDAVKHGRRLCMGRCVGR